MFLQTPVQADCHSLVPSMHKLAWHQSQCHSLAPIFLNLLFEKLTTDWLQLSQTAHPSSPTGSGLTASMQSHIAAGKGCISAALLTLIQSLTQGQHVGKHYFSTFSHFQWTLGLCESCHKQFSFQLQFHTGREGGGPARVHRRHAGGTVVSAACNCLKSPCETTSFCRFPRKSTTNGISYHSKTMEIPY